MQWVLSVGRINGNRRIQKSFTHTHTKKNKNTTWAELRTRLLEMNVLSDKTHNTSISYYINTNTQFYHTFIRIHMPTPIGFNGKMI